MKNLTPYLKALKAFETAAMTALIAALRVAGGAWPIRSQSCQRILFLLKPACKAKVRSFLALFFRQRQHQAIPNFARMLAFGHAFVDITVFLVIGHQFRQAGERNGLVFSGAADPCQFVEQQGRNTFAAIIRVHRQAQYGLETARSGVRHGGFEQIVGNIAAAYHRADDIADDFARLVAGGDKAVGDGGDTGAEGFGRGGFVGRETSVFDFD